MHKANRALWRVEVRILIFDDPAKREESQRPPREGTNCQTRAARAARAACMEKIYEIPRAAAARARCASSLPVKYTVGHTKFSTFESSYFYHDFYQ
jgi:hypothetical protein